MEEKFIETILLPFVMASEHYQKMFNSTDKPLSEQTQIKVRSRLHNVFTSLSSWVADNALLAIETNMTVDDLEQKCKKAAAYFLPQADKYIIDIKFKLTQKLKEKNPEKVNRVDPTLFVCINSVLSRGKEAVSNLCIKDQPKKSTVRKIVKTA